jgi:hypothetical protein
MNIFIPSIGTVLTLEKPWTFSIYAEKRNNRFIDELRGCGVNIPQEKRSDTWWYGSGATLLCDVSLPTGTTLTVNRIYIRQGNKEFDSVSFMVKTIVNGIKIKGRFWVKLSDVNTIEATVS